MPEGTQWEFELLDKASASAGRMFGALHKLQEQLDHSEFSFKNLEKAAAGGGASLASFAAMGGIAGLVEVGAEAIAKLTEKLFELGTEVAKEMVHAADFERTNKLVFQSITGSAEEAEQWIQAVNDIADKTATPLEEVARQLKAMSNAGFSEDAARALFAGAKDLSLKSGMSTDTLIDMFVRIKNEGSLAGRAILGMGRAIDLKKMAKELLGASASERDLKKAMMEGKIAAEQLLPAIVRASAGHGQLVGQLGLDVANGWEGGLVKIHNAWERMLGSFGETKGFDDIIKLAHELADWLNEPGNIEGFKEGVIGLTHAIEGLWHMLENVLKLTGVMSLGKGDGAGMALGKDITQGVLEAFANELVPGAGSAMAAVMAAMRGPKGADAHSPSRKTMELGEDMADGLSLGFQKGGGFALEGHNGPSVSKAGGGQNNTVHLSLEVNVGSGADHSDAHGIAAAVKEQVLSALTGAFEELAIEAGA